MRTLPNAADIAAKQVQRVSASTSAYTAGVQRVTVAPGQQAAAASQKYLNGVQANVNKWKANVAAVSLQDWAKAATEKGAARLGSGIMAAQGKIQSFWNDFLPYLGNGMAQIQQMPSDTFEQRVQKSVAMQTYLHNFKRR